jgi:hypothetical protein
MNLSNRDDSQSNTLVATKLQKGKRLYSTAGCGEDPERLKSFARRCGDCPLDIESASADSVGLEWHSRRGKEPWGDEYRKGKWVILHNVKVMATPLARASVDRGVELEATWEHREQRG